MTRCWWPQSWWHRRLRAIDRRLLFPQIWAAAAMRVARLERLPSNTSVDRLVQDYAERAIARHQRQPGQEHWRCSCARREQAS